MSGFRDHELNGTWELQPSKVINGQETFWRFPYKNNNLYGYFLYRSDG